MTEKKEKKQEILINCLAKYSLSLDELTIFQGNLKDLSDANYEKIKKSILDHGIISPWHIWNNKDKFNILDATQRTRALLKMRDEGYKIPKVPVVFIIAKSIAEAKRMVLALTSQYGNMTHDGLHEFINEAGISFDELKESFEFPEIDLAKFEAEFFESTDGNTDADEVPEVDPASVITKVGDLIEIGKHRLLCGDCTIKENVDLLMNGEKARIIHTDPPYNVNYGANKKNTSHKIREIKNDKQNPEQWREFCFKLFNVFKEYSSGDIYMWGASGPEGMKMRLWLTEIGCHWSATIIWNKDRLVLTPANYQRKYEPCFYGWFGKSSYNGERTNTEVWDIKRPHNSVLHPTMKPIELCEIPIINSSIKGNIIMDLFLGSGSTLIACEKTSRRCFGMEIDPHYCTVICQRYIDYVGTDENVFVTRDGKRLKWQDLKNRNKSVGIGANDG